MTLKHVKEEYYGGDRDDTGEGYEEYRSNESTVEEAAKAISWRVVATVSGAALILATAWVTAISSVSWDLSRNCNTIQTDIANLKQSVNDINAIVGTLQDARRSYPEPSEVKGAITESVRLGEHARTVRSDVDDLKVQLRELKKRMDDLHSVSQVPSAGYYRYDRYGG